MPNIDPIETHTSWPEHDHNGYHWANSAMHIQAMPNSVRIVGVDSDPIDGEDTPEGFVDLYMTPDKARELHAALTDALTQAGIL